MQLYVAVDPRAVGPREHGVTKVWAHASSAPALIDDPIEVAALSTQDAPTPPACVPPRGVLRLAGRMALLILCWIIAGAFVARTYLPHHCASLLCLTVLLYRGCAVVFVRIQEKYAGEAEKRNIEMLDGTRLAGYTLR